MKAILTGGAGFIGSNIVGRLIDLGHVPVVIDDLSSGFRDNIPPEVELFEADVGGQNPTSGITADCDVIFHLAASVGNKRSIDHPLRDSTTNVLGTINILEAARRCGISRVVYSSSAGIFGELQTLPIAEDHPQNPDSPYGVSKLTAEKMCLVYNKLYGMKNVCLRYFNVYGKNQRYDAYGNVIPIFAHRILSGRPLAIFGDGEQTRDFVNVQDVALANIGAALSPDALGVFNIGSGSRITVNALADMMQEVSGTRVGVEYQPPRPGDVRDSLADITAAHNAFGFTPTIGMEEGLSEYMEWVSKDEMTLNQLKGVR